jgi:hypothetical protein
MSSEHPRGIEALHPKVGVKYLREKQIQRVGVDGNEGEVCLVDREAR